MNAPLVANLTRTVLSAGLCWLATLSPANIQPNPTVDLSTATTGVVTMSQVGAVGAVAYGQINPDAWTDVVLGISQPGPGLTNRGVPAGVGAVAVHWGRSGVNLVAGSVQDPLTTSAGVIYGEAVGDGFGQDVVVGDLDGDSYDDLVVGAPLSSVSAPGGGACYIIYGGPHINGFGDWSLESIPTSAVVVRVETGATGARFGSALSILDVDGDGHQDLAVGAPGFAPTTSSLHLGGVAIVYGPILRPSSWATVPLVRGTPTLTVDSQFSATTNGLIQACTVENDILEPTSCSVRWVINSPFHSFGSKLAVGDTDADGFEDLIIGSPEAKPLGRAMAGAMTILSGGKLRPVCHIDASVTTVTKQSGSTKVGLTPMSYILGPSAGGRLGQVIAAGDSDGDGVTDIVSSVPGGPDSKPSLRSVVVYGGESLAGSSIDLGSTPPAPSSTTPTVSRIFSLMAGEQLGHSVAMGDVTGDGVAEILLGAPDANPGVPKRSKAGRIYVLPGALGQRLGPVLTVPQSGSTTETTSGEESYPFGLIITSPDNGAVVDHNPSTLVASVQVQFLISHEGKLNESEVDLVHNGQSVEFSLSQIEEHVYSGSATLSQVAHSTSNTISLCVTSGSEGEQCVSHVFFVKPMALSNAPNQTTMSMVIHGEVLDANDYDELGMSAPMAGVTVVERTNDTAVLTDEIGRFRLPVNHVGNYVLDFVKDGYITSQRQITVVEEGQDFSLEPVLLMPEPSTLFDVTSEGGTVTWTGVAAGQTTDTDLVQLIIPEDAVESPIEVGAVWYNRGDALPGPLPENSIFTAALKLTPSGTTFSQPITVRVHNIHGIDPGTTIPVGLYDETTLLWNHETVATVTTDGLWAEFQVDHFSTRDINFSGLSNNLLSSITNLDDNHCGIPCFVSGVISAMLGGEQSAAVSSSIVIPARGELGIPIPLPLYGPGFHGFPISLIYTNRTAVPGYIFESQTTNPVEPLDVANSGDVRGQIMHAYIAGRSLFRSFTAPANGESSLTRMYFDGRNRGGTYLSTGSYAYYVYSRLAFIPRAYITTAFGQAVQGASLGLVNPAELWDSVLSNYLGSYEQGGYIANDSYALIHNQRNSPYGLGWGIPGLKTLSFAKDNRGKNYSLVADGDGSLTRLDAVPVSASQGPNNAIVPYTNLGPGYPGAMSRAPFIYSGSAIMVTPGVLATRLAPGTFSYSQLFVPAGGYGSTGALYGGDVPGLVMDADPNARTVAYVTTKSNPPLSTTYNPGQNRLYVWDSVSRESQMVHSTINNDHRIEFPRVSGDGRFVYYVLRLGNGTNTVHYQKIMRYDITSKHHELIFAPPFYGGHLNGDLRQIIADMEIDDIGRVHYVAYYSQGNNHYRATYNQVAPGINGVWQHQVVPDSSGSLYFVGGDNTWFNYSIAISSDGKNAILRNAKRAFRWKTGDSYLSEIYYDANPNAFVRGVDIADNGTYAISTFVRFAPSAEYFIYLHVYDSDGQSRRIFVNPGSNSSPSNLLGTSMDVSLSPSGDLAVIAGEMHLIALSTRFTPEEAKSGITNVYASYAGKSSADPRLLSRSNGTHLLIYPDGTMDEFNALGLMTKKIDKLGNVTQFAWENGSRPGNLNRVRSITQPGGAVTTFTYDGAGLLSKIVAPSGSVNFVAAANGELRKVVLPDSSSYEMSYDQRGLLTNKVEPNGDRTQYLYDPVTYMVRGVISPSRSIASVVNGVLTTVDASERWTFEPALAQGLAIGFDKGSRPMFQVGSTTAPLPDIVPHETTAPAVWREWVTLSTAPPLDKGTVVSSGTVNAYESSLSKFTGGYLEQNYAPMDQKRTSATVASNGEGVAYEHDSSGLLSSIRDLKTSTAMFLEWYRDGVGRPYLAKVSDSYGISGIWTYQFDTTGQFPQSPRLKSSTFHDQRGHQSVTEYGKSANTGPWALKSYVDPDGQATTMTYVANGDLISVDVQNSGQVNFVLDALGLPSVTQMVSRLPDGSTELVSNLIQSYDTWGMVTSWQDALSGRSGSAQYDSMGNLLRSVASDGGVTTLDYTAKGLLEWITNPIGDKARILYDLKRDPVALERWVADTLVYRILIDRDPAGIVKAVHGPAPGMVVQFSHDSLGRVVSSQDATGRGTRVGRDGGGRLQSIWDRPAALAGGPTLPENLPQARLEYGKADEVRWTTDVLGRSSQLHWDFATGDGNPEDPESGASRGRLVGVTYADGSRSELTYDASGRIATESDEIGRTVGYAYDGLDRLTTATDAGGGLTTFGYDLRGRVRRQVLPDGTAVSTALNGAGDVAWQELSGWVSGTGADPQNSGPRLRTEYGYDIMGRVLSQRTGMVPAPGTPLPSADAPVGTAAQLDGPVTSRWNYDLLGRAVRAINAHADWKFEYDAASGKLARSIQKFVEGGAEYETRRTYTGNGTQLDTLTYPGGLRLSYGYDLAGRPTTVTQTRAAGSVTGPGGAQEAPSAGNGVWGFEYDHGGRVSRLTAPNGTVTTYERDLDGMVLAQRTIRPADGATLLLLERGFDARGRTKFEGASWSEAAASNPGAPASAGGPTIGAADVLDVDGVGQVVRVRYGATWQGKTSTGSPASHSNRPSPPSTNDVEAALTNQEFSWDELGNRRWMVIQDASLSTTLTHQTEGLNRYSEVRCQFDDGFPGEYPLEVAHDRWGRVTRDRDRLYDWDPEGRLRTVRRADDGTTVATYVYDSEGRRISRTVWAEEGLAANFTLRYVWDGDRVLEEWMVLPGDGPSGLGQLVAEYIWGAPAPNGLLAQRRLAHGPTPYDELSASGLSDWPAEVVEGAFTYPILDSRGNLRAVVSGSSSTSGQTVVLERRAISATGLPLIQDAATGSLTSQHGATSDATSLPSAYGPYLLTGHQFDHQSRWHYAWHRWISPLTYGRFTSHSPLTYPVAELNYEWVRNNGWDYVDLDGLDWYSWSDGIITRDSTNFIVGVADTVSFGIGGFVAERYEPSAGIVDYGSDNFKKGVIAATVFEAASGSIKTLAKGGYHAMFGMADNLANSGGRMAANCPTPALASLGDEVADAVAGSNWKSKINGNAQINRRTPGHDKLSRKIAERYAKLPDVEQVHLHRGFEAALGLKRRTILPNRKPDVLVVYKRKNNSPQKLLAIEIASFSDKNKLQDLYDRVWALRRQLEKLGYELLEPIVDKSLI